jgi:prevent-host-death family protein
MATPPITTETVKASEARQHWSELLNRVFRKETRVLVEKSGIPVAAIVSAEELARLNRLDAERAERFKIFDDIQSAFAGVSEEEIERETAKALAEVRVEMRKEAEPAYGRRG